MYSAVRPVRRYTVSATSCSRSPGRGESGRCGWARSGVEDHGGKNSLPPGQHLSGQSGGGVDHAAAHATGAPAASLARKSHGPALPAILASHPHETAAVQVDVFAMLLHIRGGGNYRDPAEVNTQAPSEFQDDNGSTLADSRPSSRGETDSPHPRKTSAIKPLRDRSDPTRPDFVSSSHRSYVQQIYALGYALQNRVGPSLAWRHGHAHSSEGSKRKPELTPSPRELSESVGKVLLALRQATDGPDERRRNPDAGRLDVGLTYRDIAELLKSYELDADIDGISRCLTCSLIGV